MNKKFIARWIENNDRVEMKYNNIDDLIFGIYPVLAKSIVVELRYE